MIYLNEQFHIDEVKQRLQPFDANNILLETEGVKAIIAKLSKRDLAAGKHEDGIRIISAFYFFKTIINLSQADRKIN